MNLVVCICTYKRNNDLIDLLKSFEKAIIPTNINLEFLIVDNTINYNAKKIIIKFKKNFFYNIKYFCEKKRGVVFARNRCLKEIKNLNCSYFAFFDDDCKIDKFWFVEFKKIKTRTNAKIITGPQIYPNNHLGNIFEKKIYKNNSFVKWAATNNVIMSKNILITSNIKFDINLNKFGMGEDQLFFLKLSKLGNRIIWNKNLKVYEKPHLHRKNIKWILQRSFRLGVLGNYIDKSIYGNFLGYIINYLKFIYYIFGSMIIIFFPFQKFLVQRFINLISRSIGRLMGPFLFKKINFFKK